MTELHRLHRIETKKRQSSNMKINIWSKLSDIVKAGLEPGATDSVEVDVSSMTQEQRERLAPFVARHTTGGPLWLQSPYGSTAMRAFPSMEGILAAVDAEQARVAEERAGLEALVDIMLAEPPEANRARTDGYTCLCRLREAGARGYRRDEVQARLAEIDAMDTAATKRLAAEREAVRARELVEREEQSRRIEAKRAKALERRNDWLLGRPGGPELLRKIEAGYECEEGLETEVLVEFMERRNAVVAQLPCRVWAVGGVRSSEAVDTPSNYAFEASKVIGLVDGVTQVEVVEAVSEDGSCGEALRVQLACPWDDADDDFVELFLDGGQFEGDPL
jgi:hypothetical protein